MRKYKILFSITMLMGTFSEIVECETSDDATLRKALQEKVDESGIRADGKIPKVKQIIFVETLPAAACSIENDSL
ncbi:MAG TPA: hypothetical protein VIY48_21385 [Candidatus Paceibacterota bacterium]